MKSAQSINQSENKFSAKLLKKILGTLPDRISVIDEHLQIIFSNQLGRHGCVFSQKRQWEMRCYEAKNPRRDTPCDNCHLLEVFRTGAAVARETFNSIAGHIEINAYPLLDDTGSVSMVLERVRTTDKHKRIRASLKQANQIREAMIQSFPLAIVVIDNNVFVKIWNRAAENTFGWKAEEVIEKPFALVSKNEIDVFRKHMKLVNEGKYLTKAETLCIKKNGALIKVNFSAAPLRDEKDDITGNMIVITNIRGLKRAKEEHKEMMAELQHTNKMAIIGNLASGIAHVINNPNNYILSNAQLLMDIWPCVIRILERYRQEHGEVCFGKITFSEAKVFIPKILSGLIDGTHRIDTIVNNLKKIARGNKPELDQLVDVNMVIQATISMLHKEIGKSTNCFTCELEKNLPPILGRYYQMEEVIVNLVINALQALPDRNKGIFVGTMFDKATRQIVIKVQDEGIGMPKDVQKNLFNPFYSTRLDRGGTGMGLFTCATILMKHCGTIECESTLGIGTTFYLKLPAVTM